LTKPTIALRLALAAGGIAGSAIEGNGTGLFYREGTESGKMHGGRIVNRERNLEVGDRTQEDL